MSSKAITQFRCYGLDEPIVIKPGFSAWSFVLIGGPLLLGGSLFAISQGGIINEVVGTIGVIFFGLALIPFVVVLLRSSRRGTLRFSKNGLYHGQYEQEFDWSDIGPAWVFSVRAGGMTHSDVLFLLRRASYYKAKLGLFGRMSFDLMEQQAKSRKGGIFESSIPTIAALIGDHEADMSEALDEMRRRIVGEDDAVILGIPSLIRFGPYLYP